MMVKTFRGSPIVLPESKKKNNQRKGPAVPEAHLRSVKIFATISHHKCVYCLIQKFKRMSVLIRCTTKSTI